jgi:hypothetical protein
VTPAIRAALDALYARARGPGLVDLRLDLERAITAALPSGEAVLTVGAALALPEVQDGSHWILVDDPPDGYSDGYRVRVVGPDAQVCFDADGMPGDEAEDWTDLGALNAHGFADPCRLAPVAAVDESPESRGPTPAAAVPAERPAP